MKNSFLGGLLILENVVVLVCLSSKAASVYFAKLEFKTCKFFVWTCLNSPIKARFVLSRIMLPLLIG